MSKKGGYLIIDLENIDLITQQDLFTNTKLEKIIKLIDSNYHKNVIISGIKINGIEKNDSVTNICYYEEVVGGKRYRMYTFKVYGLTLNILRSPEGNDFNYSIVIRGGGLIEINGTTDSTGKIKINLSQFPYLDNLGLTIKHATGLIMAKFNVLNVIDPIIIYNDGTVKISLDCSKEEYFEITVTGGTVSALEYTLFYFG